MKKRKLGFSACSPRKPAKLEFQNIGINSPFKIGAVFNFETSEKRKY